MKIDVLLGFEIETEYNTDALGYLDKSSYHSDRPRKFNKSFIMERDGSLDRENFEESDTVELISIPLSYKNYKKALKSFKRTILSRAKRHGYNENELYHYLCFNRSCGAHVHITLLKQDNKDYVISFRGKDYTFKGTNIDLSKVITYEFTRRINKRLFEEVKTQMPRVFKRFSEHFYRRYAQESINHLDDDERTMDWNLQPRGHVELRSFNLLGVRKWDEFFKMYEILVEILVDEFKKELRQKKRRFTEETNLRLVATADQLREYQITYNVSSFKKTIIHRLDANPMKTTIER